MLQTVPPLRTRQQVTIASLVVMAPSMPGAGTPVVISIPVVHHSGSRPMAARFPNRSRAPTVLGRAVMMLQSSTTSAILPIAGIGVLFEGLQLGQWNDITVLRPVPDRFLRGHVVIVESAGVGVEQLPPLGCIGALDVHALQEEKKWRYESEQLLFYFGNGQLF